MTAWCSTAEAWPHCLTASRRPGAIVPGRSGLFDTETGKGEIRDRRPTKSKRLEALDRRHARYGRKSDSSRVVVGLSGGIDSAVVAAIAVAAVGKENVTGVSMPGPYSSEGSVTDARRLAENLGIECLTSANHANFR